ncbi:MAG: hypothetical protein O2904_01220 [bacterium]|nr:hypothetical protein [bacterium]
MKKLSPLTLFAFLWGCATLFSLTSNIAWHTALVDDPFSMRSIAETALAFSCIVLLLRPSCVKCLLTVSILQIVDVLILLPQTPNHRLVLFFANIVILIHFLPTLSGKTFDEKRFRSALVLLLVTVYAFSFFAKLNTAFFDPTLSCAIQFSRNVAAFLQVSPEGSFFGHGAILYTVIAEAVIAILLLPSRTRIYGVFLGVLFHVSLSLDIEHHFYDFSSVMITLLLVCLPSAILSDVQKRWAWLMPPTRALRRIYAVTFLIIISLGVFVAMGLALDTLAILASYILWQLFCILALILSGTAVLFAYRAGMRCEPLQFSTGTSAVLFVMILNGISPYIGLKSRTTFAMYSNLRVEPSYSNHFIVPRSLDLFGYQSGRTLDSALEKKLLIFQPMGEIAERECIW